MTRAVDAPEKLIVQLVEFSIEGAAAPVLWTTSINPDPVGQGHVSVPRMEFEFPSNQGTLNGSLCPITVARDAITEGFLGPLLEGTPHPAVAVKIEELILPTRTGDEALRQVVFRGEISKVVRNPNNRQNLAKIFVRNEKADMKTALGFGCNAHCPWRVFGPGCARQSAGIDAFGPQVTLEQRFGTIGAISGHELTINGLDDILPFGLSYARGFVTVDSQSQGIESYDSTAQEGQANKILIMLRRVPSAWLGRPVIVLPGCTKQSSGVSGCDNTAWNNLEQFGGSGIAILDYNPIIENPQ